MDLVVDHGLALALPQSDIFDTPSQSTGFAMHDQWRGCDARNRAQMRQLWSEKTPVPNYPSLQDSHLGLNLQESLKSKENSVSDPSIARIPASLSS